jgi:hypothetical protein
MGRHGKECRGVPVHVVQRKMGPSDRQLRGSGDAAEGGNHGRRCEQGRLKGGKGVGRGGSQLLGQLS